MIVSCESCASRFVVDPAVLGPRGRRVRCARCQHVWFQSADSTDGLDGSANVSSAVQSADAEPRRQVFRQNEQGANPFGGPADAPSSSDPSAQAEQARADAQSTRSSEALDEAVGADMQGGDNFAGQDAPEDDASGDDAPSQDDLLETFQRRPRNKSARSSKPRGKKSSAKKSKGAASSGAQVPALYRQNSRIMVAAGWTALAAVALSALGAAIFARETIASRIPAAVPVYAAIGLGIKPRVLTENVAEFIKIDLSPPEPAYWRDDVVLVQPFSGSITNMSTAAVRVPPIDVQLLNPDGDEVFKWGFAPPADILAPGQRATFSTEIVDMPQDATEMRLTVSDVPRNMRGTSFAARSAPQ